MPRTADHSDALIRFRKALAVACFTIVVLMRSPLAHALTVEQITSPKGIQAWLVEEHSVPVIAFQFAFAGGAAENPRGKEGLATLVSDCSPRGRPISRHQTTSIGCQG